jgi:hypothetical protein
METETDTSTIGEKKKRRLKRLTPGFDPDEEGDKA